MKILVVGNASSVHIVNLVNRLVKKGVNVYLFTVNSPSAQLSDDVNIILSSYLGKRGYLLSYWQFLQSVKVISPDLINIHYASGYGLLSNFLKAGPPILMSVWGSDIYLFPKLSFLHKFILKLNLKNSSAIASTSVCMSREVKKYTKKNMPIYVTPFGINTHDFRPNHYLAFSEKSLLRIVTIKGLHPIYGIDRLINSFYCLIKNYNFQSNVVLDIYGEGEYLSEYKSLCIELGVDDLVQFHGKVAHSHVPSILKNADIFVALSRSESFGVSILEASSCGVPVVASMAEGLKEVVIDGVTGFIVDGNDFESVALKFNELLKNNLLRYKFGAAGREMVIANYSDEFCTDIFINTLKSVILSH